MAGRRAAPGPPRGRSTAWLVALGIPIVLIAVALVLAALAPSSGTSDAATVSPEAATSAPGIPATPDASPPDASPPDASPSAASSPAASSPADAGASSMALPSASPTEDGGMTVPSEAAEGQSERNPDTASDDVEVFYTVKTDDPVFFITIDDGFYDEAPAQKALEVIQDNQIPITSFLTESVLSPSSNDYFTEATSYGGSIQNHTVKHGSFADSATDVEWEICTAQDALEERFGARPWMLRPPYGAAANEPYVAAAAEKCGVNRIVMWNMHVENNEVEYVSAPIAAGDIVLFHWSDPYLAQGLEKILELGREQGLSPAPLEDYI
ncbi:MAG: polysaccharide deacetylase family protein [bacterium]